VILEDQKQESQENHEMEKTEKRMETEEEEVNENTTKKVMSRTWNKRNQLTNLQLVL